MLVRIAVCAAWFFAWPVSAWIDVGTLPFPGIAGAMAQETAQETAQEMAQRQTIAVSDQEQEIDTKGKTQAAPRRDAEPAPANQPVSSKAALAPKAEPFGLATERVSEGEILRKWMGVQLEIREDKQVLARCRESASSCPLAARHFLAIVDEGRARNGRARVGVINREINLSIVPTSDLAQWGVPDRWSAPLETLTTGRGDCEDYAIAKYVALRATGIAPEDIKLVVVRNTDASENHAVVAVRLGGTWVILDNRWQAMVPDRDVWRATPLFEIGEDGVRQFVAPTANAQLQDRVPASF